MAWGRMSKIKFPGSKVAAEINHGGEVERNVPRVVRDKIDDGGTVVNINEPDALSKTSQATSQATPSTPAPPNSNSAKGRKPFRKVCVFSLSSPPVHPNSAYASTPSERYKF
ncbi:hypothetical protein C8R44DRAFT_752735 [Mycena epipterygia]|nr:hypothetical protein C8R44DRAFT_752735 [Mycena epipterygia]